MKTKYIIIIIIIILLLLLIISSYYILFLRKLYSSNSVIKGNNHINVNKLMIIAHPDDELIFGGREILEEKGWKIVCITNGSSKSGNIFSFCSAEKRREEFISVMNKMDCAYEIWDYEDNYFNANWNEKILVRQLSNLLNEKKYRKIVTHNLNGEYGHIQHKKISEIIHYLKPKKLYIFDYKDSESNPYIEKINDISLLYSSQKNVIRKHYNYVIHQSLKKIL